MYFVLVLLHVALVNFALNEYMMMMMNFSTVGDRTKLWCKLYVYSIQLTFLYIIWQCVKGVKKTVGGFSTPPSTIQTLNISDTIIKFSTIPIVCFCTT